MASQKSRRQAADEVLQRAIAQIAASGTEGADFLTAKQRKFFLPDGTKNLYAKFLLDLINAAKAEGMTEEDILETILTVEEYDFLTDYEAFAAIDNLTLTAEQQDNVKAIAQEGRKGKPRGRYHKKYPENKQAVYNVIKNALVEAGYEIASEKGNFRDMEFSDPDTGNLHYLIVGQRRAKKA